MDETKLEKFYNAVRILVKEQKVQSKKISELENKINITGRFKKDLDDEKKETDKRFDSVIDRFENLEKTVEENIESIAEIESKSLAITLKLQQINESLKKINDEIKECEKKEEIKLDKTDNDNTVENENISRNEKEIKQCKFDRAGYCNLGKDKCNFLHVEETCSFFIKNGYCNKIACKKRHPKNCYFFEQGFCKWAEDCRYNHRQGIQTKQCDKCGKDSRITYYCDICENTFCNMCTVDEAHVQDPQKSNLTNNCKNIHT